MARNFKEMKELQKQKAKSGEAYKTSDDKPTYGDDRVWKIGKDTDGNGAATIRLIPSLSKDGERLNTFVSRKVHSINTERPGTTGKEKADKRWRTFLCSGKDCPVCKKGWDDRTELMNAGLEKDHKDVKDCLKWISQEELYTNIKVVEDPINEDNNGKIMLYNITKTILGICDKETTSINECISKAEQYKETDYDKYKEMLSDEFIPENVETFDPYDTEVNGKNINLKFINKKDKRFTAPADYWGFSTLDKRFKPLCTTDDEFNTLLDSAYCLDEFTNPELFPDAKMHVMSTEELEDEVKFLTFEIDDIYKVRTARKEASTKGDKEEDTESNNTQDENVKEESTTKAKEVKEVKEVKETPKAEPKEEVKTEPVKDTTKVSDGRTQEEIEFDAMFGDDN